MAISRPRRGSAIVEVSTVGRDMANSAVLDGRSDKPGRLVRTALLVAASAAAMVAALPAAAQSSASEAAPTAAPVTGDVASAVGGLDDIVVTANRRAENLQNVGISIAAFTGEQLTSLGVSTAADVAAITPNVEVVRSYASPGFNTQITIRGVGQPDFQDTT